MYQPTLGRFLTRDPVNEYGVDVLYNNIPIAASLDRTRNLYGYCGNNPINRVDPSGLDDESVSDLIEWLKKMKELQDWLDAMKGKTLEGLEKLRKRFDETGMLADQVAGYIKALEQFDPNTNCGKWYKDAYLAILKTGSTCKDECQPIGDIDQGGKNNSASNCYFDLLEAGSAQALNFQGLAQKLAAACRDLPTTSQNCKKKKKEC